MGMFREAASTRYHLTIISRLGSGPTLKKNNHQILIEDPISYNMYVQRKKVRLSLQ